MSSMIIANINISMKLIQGNDAQYLAHLKWAHIEQLATYFTYKYAFNETWLDKRREPAITMRWSH